MDKKDYTKAIKVCLEGLRVEPDQPDLNYYLIRLYFYNEETGKAIKRLEKLIGRYKDNVKFESLLAVAYYKRGWNKKAGHQFEKVYQLGERSPEFLAFYINNLIQQKQYKDAKELAIHILDSNTMNAFTREDVAKEIFSALFLIYLRQDSFDKVELFQRYGKPAIPQEQSYKKK